MSSVHKTYQNYKSMSMHDDHSHDSHHPYNSHHNHDNSPDNDKDSNSKNSSSKQSSGNDKNSGCNSCGTKDKRRNTNPNVDELEDENLNNIVRDYNKVQGTVYPSDGLGRIRRDINVKYITVENSSNRPIIAGISANRCNFDLDTSFTVPFIVQGFETKHLGVNPVGSNDQFIRLFDMNSKMPVSDTYIIMRTINSFVLRDGQNKWWIQRFNKPDFNASH